MHKEIKGRRFPPEVTDARHVVKEQTATYPFLLAAAEMDIDPQTISGFAQVKSGIRSIHDHLRYNPKFAEELKKVAEEILALAAKAGNQECWTGISGGGIMSKV